LDGGSAPPIFDENGPTVVAVTPLVVDKDDGTCKTPNR
jgi:hypothetical protein